VKLLLDTHVWIWWLLGSERLSLAERRALDRLAGSGGCHLSAMSLWEAQMLHAKGRLVLDRPLPNWLMSPWWWRWIPCRRAFTAIPPIG
jgi:PIN domain nuclease of toxin-antitoxin system